MTRLIERDVPYQHGSTHMLGRIISAPSDAPLPGIVLLHDAYGFDEHLIARGTELAELGYSVFIADLWGGRTTPNTPDDIGTLIGGMVGNRSEWQGRVTAAHTAAAEQPEIDASALVSLGYCFGGSSALEYLRTGGDVTGVIAIHAGLDLLEWEWARALPERHVLVCTGSADPMATAEQRQQLEAGLDAGRSEWQLHLYGGAVHAFTSEHSRNSPVPHLFNYDERAAERAWHAIRAALNEWIPTPALAATR